MRGRGHLAWLLVLAVTACGMLAPPGPALTWESLDLEPRVTDPEPLENIPTGPVVEVLRGRIHGGDVTVTAFRDPSGPCVGMTTSSQSGTGCGGLQPGEDPRHGRFGWISGGAIGTGEPVELSGVVGSDVAAVEVELADGRRYPALLVSLAPAEIDARFFVLHLVPEAEPVAVLAVDDDGRILTRFSLLGGEP